MSNIDLYNIFVDYTHAFDSIYRNKLTECLTLCRSNLKHYCMGRKAAFFSVGI